MPATRHRLVHDAWLAVASVVGLEQPHGAEGIHPHAVLVDGAVLAHFVVLRLGEGRPRDDERVHLLLIWHQGATSVLVRLHAGRCVEHREWCRLAAGDEQHCRH
eukprot:scaffold87645_cov50-Phaeocystis_antarctica.AAC.1